MSLVTNTEKSLHLNILIVYAWLKNNLVVVKKVIKVSQISVIFSYRFST